jgi:hypothetical protein
LAATPPVVVLSVAFVLLSHPVGLLENPVLLDLVLLVALLLFVVVVLVAYLAEMVPLLALVLLSALVFVHPQEVMSYAL